MINAAIPKVFDSHQAIYKLYRGKDSMFFFDFGPKIWRAWKKYYSWIEVVDGELRFGLFGKTHSLEERIKEMIEKEGWHEHMQSYHS